MGCKVGFASMWFQSNGSPKLLHERGWVGGNDEVILRDQKLILMIRMKLKRLRSCHMAIFYVL